MSHIFAADICLLAVFGGDQGPPCFFHGLSDMVILVVGCHFLYCCTSRVLYAVAFPDSLLDFCVSLCNGDSGTAGTRCTGMKYFDTLVGTFLIIHPAWNTAALCATFLAWGID